ncbi:tRNA N6-adenosine threonylcarbamoyltransferase [Anatilimnocola aggregata]|uniref:tRNA N6-adenosine threonylcarbamoyltransferase n=1 Tax=Anatilimnocola aggregata TaxID=2528021 RepID=A0A517YJH2_9BACT|nr:tRNA (adenosine(37)-N6)-threonylcarbamoyltransferase complex transferase subunit TsaD [Anatilimnocola aggregata]QDU30373.1 tRNA N6-adenosine threonylcarbamoyltransferase [Anatilimnocola aggregata]
MTEPARGRRFLLAIESTCDETAAAIITDDLQVLSSVVASQEELHRRYAGVVPELAARAHVERIVPVIDEAIRRASLKPADLDLIAVAHTPGLAGSLIVGVSAAKALSVALEKPLVALNHLHAHIYACRMAAARDVFPCLGLIVSGGHTSLYHCRTSTEFEPLGGTIDDAAGEAFDKVATLLGLSYPGGPAIAKAAEQGNPRAYQFPRGLRGKSGGFDFSFSGLKTAVRYEIWGPGQPIDGPPPLSEQQVADIAASFQFAVVESLAEKTKAALQHTLLPRLCVGGGVAANRLLRTRLREVCDQLRVELHFAPPELCTDNAVMGAIAWEMFAAGNFADLDLDVLPGLVRNK